MTEAGTTPAEVYVVDNDADVRKALMAALSLAGFRVCGFAEGDLFLAAVRRKTPDCIILDVHLPGRSGLDVLKELCDAGCAVPLFIVSGRGDSRTAVDAIKTGALDFIEKPFDPGVLAERVRQAIAAAHPEAGPEAPAGLAAGFPGRELLTPREHQVLELITRGLSNKEAGRQLGISPRTIEVHRARVMDKLGARNTVDLVHIVLADRGRT
jgi:two-component system, LuxR family, response regulator FixJ